MRQITGMAQLALFEKILSGQSLSFDESRHLLFAIFDEGTGLASKGAALGMLRMRGVTGLELAGFASVLRERAISVRVETEGLVDTCGTGGGAPSFNLSTAAAIVASAAGVPIAKHGNRAVTSKCGSADVLEACGVTITDDPEILARSLRNIGLAFLFAPAHHPTMKTIGPIRKELGFKTVFNQLGPLANPFRAKRQLLGVYDASLVKPMAEALQILGAERALVVHSADGLDEISPCSMTFAAELDGGVVTERTLSPADFGLHPIDSSALAPGESVAEGAEILKMAISDASSPRSMAILPNVAAALWIGGVAQDFPTGAALGREAIGSGAAAQALQKLAEESRISSKPQC